MKNKRSDILLRTILEKNRKLVDSALRRYIPGTQLKNDVAASYPQVMRKAVSYAVFPGGKRIRPVLTILTAGLFNKPPRAVMPAACGIELIHSYSLVHDDLPCMDNDDYRRGKKTLHKKFGESTAVLAGDALLTEAFRLFALNSGIRGVPARAVTDSIMLVSAASGAPGMIGGQAADTIPSKMPRKAAGRKKLLDYIAMKKTAALIEASVVCGAVLSGAGRKDIAVCAVYGSCIGKAFQIVDDVFDAGTDKDRITYPSLYGLEGSMKMAESLVSRAKGAIKKFGKKALPLELLADYVVRRKN